MRCAFTAGSEFLWFCCDLTGTVLRTLLFTVNPDDSGQWNVSESVETLPESLLSSLLQTKTMFSAYVTARFIFRRSVPRSVSVSGLFSLAVDERLRRLSAESQCLMGLCAVIFTWRKMTLFFRFYLSSVCRLRSFSQVFLVCFAFFHASGLKMQMNDVCEMKTAWQLLN